MIYTTGSEEQRECESLVHGADTKVPEMTIGSALTTLVVEKSVGLTFCTALAGSIKCYDFAVENYAGRTHDIKRKLPASQPRNLNMTSAILRPPKL